VPAFRLMQVPFDWLWVPSFQEDIWHRSSVFTTFQRSSRSNFADFIENLPRLLQKNDHIKYMLLPTADMLKVPNATHTHTQRIFLTCSGYRAVTRVCDRSAGPLMAPRQLVALLATRILRDPIFLRECQYASRLCLCRPASLPIFFACLLCVRLCMCHYLFLYAAQRIYKL
jgi:hypothetical protein